MYKKSLYYDSNTVQQQILTDYNDEQSWRIITSEEVCSYVERKREGERRAVMSFGVCRGSIKEDQSCSYFRALAPPIDQSPSKSTCRLNRILHPFQVW